MDLVKCARVLDQARGTLLAVDIFAALAGGPAWADPRYQLETHSADDPSVVALQQALIEAVRADPTTGVAGRMVHALGKRRSPALRSFFIDVLAQTVDSGSAPALFEAVMALSDLREQSLRNVECFDAGNHERNQHFARCVLRGVDAAVINQEARATLRSFLRDG